MFMKTLSILFFLVIASLTAFMAGTPTAQAAGETATVSSKVNPNTGSTLYKEAFRPASWNLATEIQAQDGSPKIIPTKQIKVKLPNQIKFNPNSLPVCTDKQFNVSSNLAAGPDDIIKLCPNAVVGNGKASFYIAGLNIPNALVNDVVLVAFNAGYRNNVPAIKIYGFSDTTNVGIYLLSTLNKDGTLNFNIPVLSNDSALSTIELNIPGMAAENIAARGKTKNFLTAKCSTGTYHFNADYTFGTRAYPSGVPTNENTYFSTSTTESCPSAKGNAKAKMWLKGAKKVKTGKKLNYKVKISNPGTATLKNVRLNVSGKVVRRSQKISNLAPGASRTVKFVVKPKGKKGQKAKLKFKLQSNTKALFQSRTVKLK
jgi:hypothetical protein